jgi:hypothetical protein
VTHFTAGDEYVLVDEFAAALRLREWFEWKPSAGPASGTALSAAGDALGPPPQGPTNPALLKEKEGASLMYLLDSLKRFDRMSEDEIRQVAVQIGLIGMEGIDYASAERRYALKAFPGESFSGLHLLCLMYAGFRRVDPSADTGLDFADAYEMALKLHEARAN